jgi:hypothetical protein
MKIQFVTISFHSQYHIQKAIAGFNQHFPKNKLLVIDNNPLPGEAFDYWRQFNSKEVVEKEKEWLQKRNDIIFVRSDIETTNEPLTHGDGLNFARRWCLEHGFDAMCHFEPDCSITGRNWYERLKQGIDWGYWMCGLSQAPGHGIRPCPALWLLKPTKHIDFNIQPKGEDVNHPRYDKLIAPGVYAKARGEEVVSFYKTHWDTGIKLWFECAIRDKALCNPPTNADFVHLWNGSEKNVRNIIRLLRLRQLRHSHRAKSIKFL